jgi:hypothetical protein
LISWLTATFHNAVGALFSEWAPPCTAAAYPILPQTVSDALAQLPRDDEALRDVLSLAKDLYAEADARQSTVESKATNLLGATGLAATLLTASAGLLLNRSDFVGRTDILPFGLLLIATLLTFLYAAYKAARCLRLSPWAQPGPLALYQPDVTSLDLRRQWTAHLLVAKAYNDSITDEKGGWLKEAQAWFILGLALLVFTTLALVLTAVFGAPQPPAMPGTGSYVG